MTHRELYAEACRKAFENYQIPKKLLNKKVFPRKCAALWTTEEVKQLVEYCKQGLRSFEIAKLMGKTPKAIQKAFVRFGFPRLHNICPPSGADNPAWKGGVHIGKFGYRFVRMPDHPHANSHGYVMEHRLVVEEHLGRFLLPSEVVHHKDGNHANNDISNLEVFASNGEHLRATITGIPHNVSPENRKMLSELTNARWRDPEMVKKMTSHRPEFAEKIRKRWQDPVYREKALSGIRRCAAKRRLRSTVPSSSSSQMLLEIDARP